MYACLAYQDALLALLAFGMALFRMCAQKMTTVDAEARFTGVSAHIVPRVGGQILCCTVSPNCGCSCNL